jgi:hypothetical protein
MSRALGRRLLLGLICMPVLFAACAGASATTVETNALLGKRVAGTPASWSPITKFKYLRGNFSRQSSAPVLTGTARPDESLDGISFYEFASSRAATAFYLHPPEALVSSVGGRSVSLTGSGPAHALSRWLDLEQCIYEGSGPNPNLAPKGAPAALPNAIGVCAIGSSKSGGIASITQRGRVVFVVNPNGFRQSDAPARRTGQSVKPSQ